jgi:maleylpyruvate isomerase
MPRPHDVLASTAAAHERVHATLDGLTDETARQPSRLPGWTVGHVVTHLARNADSVVRRLDGAAAGSLVSQYEGGREGRAREIADGARRPAAELLDDMHAAHARLEQRYADLPDEAWQRPVLDHKGNRISIAEMAFHRWREVETHHVDLGLGYGVTDWPEELAAQWLPTLLAGLPGRANRQELVGWLIGRGAAPELGTWE